MSYVLLNSIVSAVVLLCVAAAARRFRITTPRLTPVFLSLVILLLFTAVFDSLIIIADIVHYDASTLTGLSIWKAPIEDFSYSLLAIIIIPILWNIGGVLHARKT